MKSSDLTWDNWEKTLEGCTRCPLCHGRQHIVPGCGDIHARLMLIGEGPGAMEDEQGLPFVGPAGQLLDRMLAAIGPERSQVYIANVVKCRPPGNRTPEPAEVMACRPFLRGQVALIRPKIIVALGATAAKVVLKDEDFHITRQRGQWKEAAGVRIMATYHPSYLLRAPEHKKEAWADMQALQKALEETV